MTKRKVMVVFRRPTKENDQQYICVKCAMVKADYVTEFPLDMYNHMTRHWNLGHSIPDGVFAQLTSSRA